MNEVEEIKSRLDIVEVVSSYIPLKQAGSNWKGMSPFKAEKTASFMVSSDKGIWHDFSSGQGGDVFSFVMLMEGMEFREALEILAKKAGLELKPRSQADGQKSKSNTRLYDALEIAMKYYHLTLSKNPEALKYFREKRSLKPETIKAFRLGYSPDTWESLSNYLLKKGFTQSELKDAGLARQKDGRDTVYDLFRSRVMFPIFDSQGRVVGFSARILEENIDSAKYINTPDSSVYHKSSAIYGLLQAKDSIRTLDEVIVVEGNMDVVALANGGQKNVVASSGTALTLEQLRILSRLTKNIKLCFDQDDAGIKATQRVVEMAGEIDAKLMVISYTNAKDPDELITKDSKAWHEAVRLAQYAPDYIFSFAKTKFDVKTALGKKQFANFVLPTVAHLHDEIEKHHYVKKLAQLVDVPEQTLQQKIETGLERKPVTIISAEPEVQSSKPKRQLTRAEKIERITLELMLARLPSRDVLQDIDYENLSDLHKPIFLVLRDNPKANTARLAKLLPKFSDYVKILSLRGEHVYSAESDHDARLEAFTQIYRLKKIVIEKTKRQLTRLIAEAEAVGDQGEVKKLLLSYQALVNEE
ncbi:DNA primase [Candidatus Saccharibacteria bacterium]|nr:DNA primase [Candidatus Saccharibacteria bacterium]